MRACLAVLVLLCGCGEPASTASRVTAMRYERSVGGRWQYVVTLPDHGLYAVALHTAYPRYWIGSNAEPPHVFVRRGTIADAAERLGWGSGGEPMVGESIEIAQPLIRELVELVDRRDDDGAEARRVANRCFEAGLVPKLWQLDLDSFGK